MVHTGVSVLNSHNSSDYFKLCIYNFVKMWTRLHSYIFFDNLTLVECPGLSLVCRCEGDWPCQRWPCLTEGLTRARVCSVSIYVHRVMTRVGVVICFNFAILHPSHHQARGGGWQNYSNHFSSEYKIQKTKYTECGVNTMHAIFQIFISVNQYHC